MLKRFTIMSLMTAILIVTSIVYAAIEIYTGVGESHTNDVEKANNK